MNEFADRAGLALLRLLTQIFNALPLPVALKIGDALGRIAFYISSRRSVAYADMKAALGPVHSEQERWQIIKKHFGTLGQMFVEVLRFPQIDASVIESTIQFPNLDRLHEIFSQKRGGIFMSAHFGNWELAQIAVIKKGGKPIHVLARDQKHTKLNDYLNSLRESQGSVSTSRGMGVRDLWRSLRRKEVIGVLADQDAGREGGIILPFFGRKTTVPTGSFELALRTDSAIFPTFLVRRQGEKHDLCMEAPIIFNRDQAPDDVLIEAAARNYLSTLETYIRRHPEQWLWETKRWKYSWTKRILILSDGKAGHVKQSRAVAKSFQDVTTQHGRPGMEYPTETLEVRFKSPWHRKLFSVLAFFFIPFAQGRLRFLKFFFTPETFSLLMRVSADFVISAGSSLVPLNLCLAQDFRAKSIVIMKPSFPFNLYHYDLAVVPAHDRGRIAPQAFRPVLAPSTMDPADMEAAGQKLKSELKTENAPRIAVFLGGPTRRFQMETTDIKKLFQILNELEDDTTPYMITTSRRTPLAVTRFLKKEIAPHASCSLLILADEDSRPHVVPGMMALADILIVTEDSVSMISEAVMSRKRVIVLSFASEGLPAKHTRFRELLERESAIVLSSVSELAEKIQEIQNAEISAVAEKEQASLRKRLQEIL